MLDFNEILSTALKAAVREVLDETAYQPVSFNANAVEEVRRTLAHLQQQINAIEEYMMTQVPPLKQSVEGLSALAQAAAIAFPPAPTDAQAKLDELHAAVSKLVQVPQPSHLSEGFLELAQPLRNYIDTVVEQSMEHHNDVYDHNQFYSDSEEIKGAIESWVERVARDVFDDDLETVVRGLLRNATLSLEV